MGVCKRTLPKVRHKALLSARIQARDEDAVLNSHAVLAVGRLKPLSLFSSRYRYVWKNGLQCDTKHFSPHKAHFLRGISRIFPKSISLATALLNVDLTQGSVVREALSAGRNEFFPPVPVRRLVRRFLGGRQKARFLRVIRSIIIS